MLTDNDRGIVDYSPTEKFCSSILNRDQLDSYELSHMHVAAVLLEKISRGGNNGQLF